jgi:hypothetical protein
MLLHRQRISFSVSFRLKRFFSKQKPRLPEQTGLFCLPGQQSTGIGKEKLLVGLWKVFQPFIPDI